MFTVTRFLVLCFIVVFLSGCATTSSQQSTFQGGEKETLSSKEMKNFFTREILMKLFRGGWTDFKGKVVMAFYPLYSPEAEARSLFASFLTDQEIQKVFSKRLKESHPWVSEEECARLVSETSQMYVRNIPYISSGRIQKISGHIDNLIEEYNQQQRVVAVGYD